MGKHIKAVKSVLVKDLPKAEFSLNSLEASKHQTPFFLFSREKIVNNYLQFKKYFPGASVFYAIKANPEMEVLKTLHNAGCGFEVASIYELNLLKKLKPKISLEKIIYGTSVKPIEQIRAFYRYGVRTFAADSFPELEKLAMAAPKSKVFIRARVNDAGSVYRFSEKFGTDLQNVALMLERAKALKLIPYGISFHVGSQATNPMAWAEAIESLMPVLDQLEKAKIKIEMINIGGGFPCNYVSMENKITLEEIARNTLNAFRKLSIKPKLIIEPGRGIIADAGTLITTVIARVERMGSNWLFLDAGAYNALFEAMAYQGSTRYRITSLRSSYDAGEAMFALAGPTGDSQDVITREALLPQDIGEGDQLIVHDIGAYSLAVSSSFNGFPKPGVYFI